MSCPSRGSRHRPAFRLSAWLALGPIAIAACGDDEADVLPLTRQPVSETPATVVPAGGLPARESAPARAATYADAESMYQEGRFDEARRLFEGHLATRPEHAFGHYMLGMSAWKSGDLETAEAAFDRALALDTTHVKTYLNSARVLMELGRDGEALERVSRALDLDSTSSEGFRLLARAQHRLGEIEAALDTYRHALITNDRDVWAMNNLGVLYLEERDPESALPPLARAVELRPNAPVFRNNLGMALERAGFTGLARDTYEAALRSDSTYPRARTNLARVTRVLEQSPSVGGTTDLRELADLFRFHIRMWRDTATRPDPTGTSPVDSSDEPSQVPPEPTPEAESDPTAPPATCEH